MELNYSALDLFIIIYNDLKKTSLVRLNLKYFVLENGKGAVDNLRAGFPLPSPQYTVKTAVLHYTQFGGSWLPPKLVYPEPLLRVTC